jgi:hypothetical protein
MLRDAAGEEPRSAARVEDGSPMHAWGINHQAGEEVLPCFVTRTAVERVTLEFSLVMRRPLVTKGPLDGLQPFH